MPENIHPTTSTLTRADYWDHILTRWGYKRGEHRVAPGLYALGNPTAESPIMVTANYTLSFDALRSALAGMDGYILVLDTHGINVWCAAGKGTFGTDELVQRVQVTGLREVVSHRTLILPQLGAPGVNAFEVRKRSGFKVEYGPVRAADLPAYLKTHTATPEMRQVRFTLADRLVLIPIELMSVLLPMLVVAVVMYFIGGLMSSLAVMAAVLAGAALFPALLPWIPTADFSTKGFLLGLLVTLPFAWTAFQGNPETPLWRQSLGALTYLLPLPPVTAFLALNFTGATPITSRSGVKKEIYTYIPAMAWLFGVGIVMLVALFVMRLIGV